jgi:hypothetical protein
MDIGLGTMSHAPVGWARVFYSKINADDPVTHVSGTPQFELITVCMAVHERGLQAVI